MSLIFTSSISILEKLQAQGGEIRLPTAPYLGSYLSQLSYIVSTTACGHFGAAFISLLSLLTSQNTRGIGQLRSSFFAETDIWEWRRRLLSDCGEKSQMFTLFFASDTFVRILSTITLKTGDILRIMFYLRQIN